MTYPALKNADLSVHLYEERETHFAGWKAGDVERLLDTLAILLVLRKHSYYTAKKFKRL